MQLAVVLIGAALAAALCPHSNAQDPAAPGLPASPSRNHLGQDFVVPIHSLPMDPEFGEYGVWAGGRAYKVRFDRAVTFYPRLGASAPRNLPLTWRTISVRLGGEVLADAATPVRARAASPVRYEYERGPVVEAYDVRPEGIEQTFTLAHKPDLPAHAVGDLVVEGSVATELRALPAADRHADLDFADVTTGHAVARYGRAFAVDATGRKLPITTAYDGSRIRLCVPAAFVRAAVFPLVIDPLTTPVSMNIDVYLHADMGANRRSSGQVHLFAYSLYTSATDIDMVVFSHGPSFSPSHQLFADISDSWHANHPAIAYCGSTANRWVLAFERQNSESLIRLYLHDRDDTGFNTGQLVFMSRMTDGAHDWRADVGGHYNSNLALVVCQSEFGAQFNPGAPSNVYGRLVDVATGSMASAPLPLSHVASFLHVREGVTVNTDSSGSHWQTAWSERLLGKFEVHTAQVRSDGTVLPAVRIDDPAQDFHKVAARIDGRQREFLVTYALADNLGDEHGRFLHGTRFTNLDPQITDVRHRALVAAGAAQSLVNTGLAFDSGTGSHWGLGWHTANATGTVPLVAFAARAGFAGGLVEQQPLTASNGSSRPVLAYAGSLGFAIGYNVTGAPLARHLVYPPAAGSSVIGPGCGPSTISCGNPYAGSQSLSVALFSAPASQTAVPLLAFGAGSLPLDFLGMSGCVLHLAPATLLSLPPRTITALGAIAVTLPLPETFTGDLYAQWWFSDPAAAGGARVSPALQIRVR